MKVLRKVQNGVKNKGKINDKETQKSKTIGEKERNNERKTYITVNNYDMNFS
jgi:hypothetical protein